MPSDAEFAAKQASPNLRTDRSGVIDGERFAVSFLRRDMAAGGPICLETGN